MSAESSNALKQLLASGLAFGSEYASGKLFGAREADEYQLQQERLAYAQVNGSGPVNGRESLLSPKSWTDMFFGTRTAAGPNDPAGATANAAGGPNPVATIALIVVVLAIGWFVSRKL